MVDLSLLDKEFSLFQDMIYRVAGISLSSAKKALVASRLAKRVKHHGLCSYGDYYRLLHEQQEEMGLAIDLLTTNETYFFREPKHFDFLCKEVLPACVADRPFRVWSAACSSGEEVYTLAMLLADGLADGLWEVLGSDISTRVLDKARGGLYEMARAKGIPRELLRAHCLKGKGRHEGYFLIDEPVRRRVNFARINLNESLPDVGLFDVIFLRNVMIYFQPETKRQVVARLLSRLRPGGFLFVGHSESLNGLAEGLEIRAPSVYRKR